jgi:hypothetical protein
MKPKNLYLLLSVLGFLLPYSQFVPWVAANGLRMPLFFSELGANRISMFFGWDVIVSAVVLLAFMRIERARKPVKHWWIPIVGTLLVGVSFGFPLFLYLREDAGQSQNTPA